MAQNDFLLMYTDGVTEGRGPRQEPYGTAGIIELLSEFKDESARVVATEIEKDIVRYIGKADQHDDITMVILKNCPPPSSESPSAHDAAAEEPRRAARPGIDSVTVQNDHTKRS